MPPIEGSLVAAASEPAIRLLEIETEAALVKGGSAEASVGQVSNAQIQRSPRPSPQLKRLKHESACHEIHLKH